MTTKIETTAEIRAFNEELQACDNLLEANAIPFAGELSLNGTLAALRANGLRYPASGLQAAAQAVGYTFPAQNGQG